MANKTNGVAMASPKASNAKKPSAASIGGAEERDLQSFREIADDVIESDFVPYACLYNPTTIITKDGELLQTIKINKKFIGENT